MSLIPAPDDHVEARRRVAAAVSEALTLAGLPAHVSTGNSTHHHAGVQVEIDAFADAGGGVFVSWQTSAELLDQVAGPLLAHEFGHPAIRLGGAIADAMTEALRAILVASGFDVELSDDEYRPSTLRVL